MNEAYKIAELARFCFEQSQGEHDVFFEYSPHVHTISFTVFFNGWDTEALATLTEVYHLKNRCICVDDIKMQISHVLRRMK